VLSAVAVVAELETRLAALRVTRLLLGICRLAALSKSAVLMSVDDTLDAVMRNIPLSRLAMLSAGTDSRPVIVSPVFSTLRLAAPVSVAVMLFAEKLPLLLRKTMVLIMLDELAVVAVLSTRPAVVSGDMLLFGINSVVSRSRVFNLVDVMTPAVSTCSRPILRRLVIVMLGSVSRPVMVSPTLLTLLRAVPLSVADIIFAAKLPDALRKTILLLELSVLGLPAKLLLGICNDGSKSVVRMRLLVRLVPVVWITPVERPLMIMSSAVMALAIISLAAKLPSLSRRMMVSGTLIGVGAPVR